MISLLSDECIFLPETFCLPFSLPSVKFRGTNLLQSLDNSVVLRELRSYDVHTSTALLWSSEIQRKAIHVCREVVTSFFQGSEEEWCELIKMVAVNSGSSFQNFRKRLTTLAGEKLSFILYRKPAINIRNIKILLYNIWYSRWNMSHGKL